MQTTRLSHLIHLIDSLKVEAGNESYSVAILDRLKGPDHPSQNPLHCFRLHTGHCALKAHDCYSASSARAHTPSWILSLNKKKLLLIKIEDVGVFQPRHRTNKNKTPVVLQSCVQQQQTKKVRQTLTGLFFKRNTVEYDRILNSDSV